MKKKNWTVSHDGLGQALGVACLGLLAQQAVAQEPSAQGQQGVEEVTVTGTRLITSGVNTPTPVTSVSSVDLQKMSPSTLIESLSQLPVFDNNLSSQQAVGGSVAPGGSNLNLRGLDAPRTLVLLDGRRLGPSNKYGTVDVGVIPETLVRNVEAVTGGASAAYGADAVAGVVNFRLDRKLSGFKYALQAGATTYGDDDTYKAGVAYGTDIGEKGHVIAAIETWHKDGISTVASLNDRKDFYNLKAQVTNPDPNGPNFLTRPYVSPTNFTPGGIILQTGSALDHVEFLPDGTGRYQPLPFSGVGQLTGGCNCQARPTLEYGVNEDFQFDTPADRGVLFAHYDHEVNEHNSFFVETLLADTSQSNRWQTAALLGPWQGRLYVDNPFLPAGIRQQMQAENRQFVGFGIFTPNVPGNPFEGGELIAKNRYGQVTGGFNHDLPDGFLAGGWSLGGYVQYAQNRQETVDPGGMRTDRLFLAMDAVTGPTWNPVCRVTLFNPGVFDSCVPINLIGGTAAVTPAAANYVIDNGKIARGRVTEDDVEVTLARQPHEGLGRRVRPDHGRFRCLVARGAAGRPHRRSVRRVSVHDRRRVDERPRVGRCAGMRGITAEGTPGGVPGLRFVPPGFAGDANSSTVLFSSQRTVERRIQRARGVLRVRHSAAAGRQVEPRRGVTRRPIQRQRQRDAWKTGVSYQITPRFRIRATESQDVRAPTLRERFESQRGGVNVNDPANGNALITTAQLRGRKPERRPRNRADQRARLRVSAVWTSSR